MVLVMVMVMKFIHHLKTATVLLMISNIMVANVLVPVRPKKANNP